MFFYSVLVLASIVAAVLLARGYRLIVVRRVKQRVFTGIATGRGARKPTSAVRDSCGRHGELKKPWGW